MRKDAKFETGNVGVQFIGKPSPAKTGDPVLEQMTNAAFAENKDNQENRRQGE